ncbi:hypothetical protein FQU23_016065, partial [Flavobacterium sp. XN-5]|uniref:beta strand repeat-containing protein n=1 Tax=Flavobacterium sp. XN-5 TaxID=2599390 RepID=UPI0013FB6E7A
YNVIVTVAGCTSAAGSTTVLVNPIPVTPTASNNGTLCVGSTLNLTTPLVSGATYSWIGPNNFSSGLQNPSISAVTLATAGTYNVTVTVAGCTSAAGSTTVVVNPIPATPTASNNGPLCVGSTLNLTTPLVSGATYSWTGPNSFSSGLQNPSISGVNLATAGTYNVTVTVAGCTSAAGSTTVVVNPIPATPTASNNGPLCVGSTLNLTTPLVSGATYSWTGPNSFSSGLQNPSISGVTLAAAGTYNVTVTVAGCPSAAGSITVVVNPIPATPTASNNGPLCVGSTLNLTTPLVSGATYSWTGPNSFSSGLQNPSISGVTLATAGTYNVTVTVAGCPSAAGSTSVVVNPLLTPSVVITSSSTSICSGTSVTFTATPTNGGSAPSYQWKNGATLVGTNSPTFTTTALANNAAISVVMNSNAICPSPSTATSNNIVMSVFTGTPSGWNGSTNITVSNQSICPPATVNLSVPAASNAQYYQWNLPTGWIITSGNLTNSITVSVSSSAALGTQVIAVKAINPCGENTTVSTPSNGKNQIIVNSFNGVTVSPSSQTVCANSSIIITGLLTGNATSGNWTATNGNITLQSQVGSTITAVFTPTISGGSATATITTNIPTGSCPNTPATATVAVTVSPLPIAAGTINGSATVCQGQNSVTYTVPAITNATGYTWSLPTG